MWLGIDDTDGPSGGCTTHVLTEVIGRARDLGIDLLGEPRLVRLNPNIPWRTRGNAALAARFGHGRGPRTRQGTIGDRPVWSRVGGRPLSNDEAELLIEAAWETVRSAAAPDPGTDPALVATRRRPSAQWYWRAVRNVVPVSEVRTELARIGAQVRTAGSRRGLVGATAGIAWPGTHATWEAISYRRPARIGSPRSVDAESVRAAQRRFPPLFLCDDPRTRRLMVTPHTRCPILFGLRSTERSILSRARASVTSETVDRWMIFRTNQGTGDHLLDHPRTGPRPFESARLRGTVDTTPERMPGGHVRVVVRRADGRRVTCWAFEPSKTLPAVARSLLVGDDVEVWGGRGPGAGFRLEGIVLRHLIPRGRRVPPRCRACDRAASSMGTARGYRCPGCHARFPPESGTFVEVDRDFPEGTYHPTPSARRHLAPLGPEAIYMPTVSTA